MLHRSPRDSFCLGTFAHGFVILPPRSLAKTRGCLLAKIWILWGVGQFCDHIPAINLVNNCIFFQVTSGYILQAKSFSQFQDALNLVVFSLLTGLNQLLRGARQTLAADDLQYRRPDVYSLWRGSLRRHLVCFRKKPVDNLQWHFESK